MNKLRHLLFAVILFSFFSCEKEYSMENSVNNSTDLIVGIDCRINKIVYTDTATNTGLGSIFAPINALHLVTKITKFDSLSNTIDFITSPTYSNDTIFINPDEYFVVDIIKRITKMHGLIDPTDPFSLQFNVFYLYNTAGNLITKSYFLLASPTAPFYQVNYTYSLGNLTHMTGIDLSTGNLVVDADMAYYGNIIPNRFLYIFPDENGYSNFSQFYNYGLKNFNAIKNMTIRNYDPGNVVRDSSVCSFSNYIMSRDTYVLSVQMKGDNQQSIPALAGKLSFFYKCK